MNRTRALYALLFLLVIVAACVFGTVVATSITLRPFSSSSLLNRLVTPTPTPGHVDARVLTPSPKIPGTADATPLPGQPAPVVVPTVMEPTLAFPATSTPTVSPTPGTPTATPTPRPTRTPTQPPYPYLLSGAPRGVEDRGCFVGAVFGYVLDSGGQGLPGVRVRVSDPWGNVSIATTKDPPDTGYYDVILGTSAATYRVQVVDGSGAALSPAIEVTHAEGSRACWYQVDFRRAGR